MIKHKIGVSRIEDKIKEAKLRWFGHVRRSIDAPAKRCESIDLREIRRG